MPSSFAKIVLHTVFSTKHRLPCIQPADEAELSYIMHGEFKRHGARLIRFGAVPDHVHLVHTLSRTTTLSKLIQGVKGVSSGWLKSRGEVYQNFAWQIGYASFSADYRRLDGLLQYVDNQKEHHGWVNHSRDMDGALSYRTELLDYLESYDLMDEVRLDYLFPGE